MHFGLAVSVVLHLGVFAWTLITIQSTPPVKIPELEAVEVAVVSPDALVKLKKGDREAKQLEAQPKESAAMEPPKKETPKAAAPPPAQEPPPPEPAMPEPPQPEPPKSPAVARSEPQKDPIAEKLAALPPPAMPEPGPAPDEKKLIEEKLERERKAEEARKQAEAKKKVDEERKKKLAESKKKAEAEKKRKEVEAKKKQFDAQRIAALLNKVPDKSSPPAGAPTPLAPTKAKGPVAGADEGHDSQLTASQRSLLGAMMKRAVSRCWNVNSGLDGADKVVVEVEVRLRPDGRLLQAPRVTNSGLGPLFADAADSAVRALVQCEPYDLPTDLYEGGWDHMVVTFDPQRMF